MAQQRVRAECAVRELWGKGARLVWQQQQKRARDASATTPAFCHGQGPGQDNNRAQEWESDRASKQASERASEREARKHKRQETKTADGSDVVGSEFHKSLQEAAAAGQKFVDFVVQCIQIRICPMIQPNLDFNFK